MNIFIVCKRRPQQKDLWERPNGRFYHLAKYLAAAGHQVDFFLLGYDSDSRPAVLREGITWHCVGLLPDPLRIYRRACQVAGVRHPDWVIGFSDTWYGILAVLLARRLGAKSLVDAYDNYESYLPWCKPLHGLWRLALRQANCVTAPGRHLLEKMARGRKGGAALVPMAADPQFVPMEKAEARHQLGLPAGGVLIGYCGSVHGNRDMATFFAAMAVLAHRQPDYRVVMTGRIETGMALPPQVLHLGYLPDDRMAVMVNALDVMVAVNKPSAFGSYSYPVKILEALACGVPVIATETPSVAELLGNNPDVLVPAGDAEALALRLEWLLSGQRRLAMPPVEGWQAIAARLEGVLTGKVLNQ